MSFSLAASTLSLLLQPPTEPNFIFAGPVGELTDGEHQFLPANSTVQFFNLESLSYACAIESGVSATPCTIQLAGQQAPEFGGQTSVVNLVYDPDSMTSLVTAYDNASFSTDFVGLISVTANIIDEAASDTLSLLEFDIVTYTAFVEE